MLVELDVVEERLPLVKGCRTCETLEQLLVMRRLGRDPGDWVRREHRVNTGGETGMEEAGVGETVGGVAGVSGETPRCLELRGRLSSCCSCSMSLGRRSLSLDLLGVLRVEQLQESGAVPGGYLLLLLWRSGLLFLLL